MRRLLCVLALAGSVACGEDDVRIIGTCELDVVERVVDRDDAEGAPAWPSVGMIEGMVLVSWVSSTPAWQYGQWFDTTLAPMSSVFPFGTTKFGWRPRWVQWQGRLAGQVWADPAGRLPPPPEHEMVHVFVVPPGELPNSPAERVEIPIYEWACEGSDCLRIGGASYSPGAQTLLPIAVVGDETLGVAVGPPDACRDLVGDRLFMFSATPAASGPLGRRAQVVRWGEEPCDASDFMLRVADPWPIDTANGARRVLVRAGLARDGRLRLLHIAPDGTLVEPPRVVGVPMESTVDGGFQPRAVVLPGGRILFTDRRGGTNECHALGIMNEDGTDAREAPWQLPCIENERAFTSSVELVSVPAGAVLLWSERTRIDTLRILEDTRYEERIRAVLLTPEGERGSAIVDVTPPESTVLDDVPRGPLGPIPRDYLVSAASEGESVAVAWRDERPDAPGIYVRRLRCSADR